MPEVVKPDRRHPRRLDQRLEAPPERYGDLVDVAPADINKRTNAGKAEWAAFEAAAAGKSIITADEAQTVQAMANAILAHPLAANLFDRRPA